jgi:hypothetical protein
MHEKEVRDKKWNQVRPVGSQTDCVSEQSELEVRDSGPMFVMRAQRLIPPRPRISGESEKRKFIAEEPLGAIHAYQNESANAKTD